MKNLHLADLYEECEAVGGEAPEGGGAEHQGQHRHKQGGGGGQGLGGSGGGEHLMVVEAEAKD